MFPLSQLGGRRRLSPGWEEERSPGRLVEVKNADEISKSPSLGLRLASILSISRGVPEMGRADSSSSGSAQRCLPRAPG
jgi:hypothetical protein